MLDAAIKYAPMCRYVLCVDEYLLFLIIAKCPHESFWLTIIVFLLSFLICQGLKSWHAFSYIYLGLEYCWKFVENV